MTRIVPLALRPVQRPGLRRSPTNREPTSIPVERIERAILLIRKQKVMLDADLASLDEVETRSLVRVVKRNLDRFPRDFMFQLSKSEFGV